LKVAIAGKGGVGKTTVAATLARLLGRAGFDVLAIDADPAMNLAAALGVPSALAGTIVPISDNPNLVEERTGARPGETSGAVFNLTPRVEDLASKFGVPAPDNTRLLVLGTVKSAGSGCMCPANALLRALLRHVFLQKGEAVVMDMEAGLEHLGRGVIRGVDVVLTILEPRPSSVQVHRNIAVLAGQLGIRTIMPVGNKIMDATEEEFLRHEIEASGHKLVAAIPYDANIIKAEMAHTALLEFAPDTPSVKVIEDLKQTLIEGYGT
jgi:CO dehydrogenase maturation factor